MAPQKINRRTLSKVEQQLEREKIEQERLEKKKRHMQWLARQQNNKKYQVVNKPQQIKKHVVIKVKVEEKVPEVKKQNIEKNEVYISSTWILNNSWADHMEFEDLRKKMLIRMAFNKMI